MAKYSSIKPFFPNYSKYLNDDKPFKKLLKKDKKGEKLTQFLQEAVNSERWKTEPLLSKLIQKSFQHLTTKATKYKFSNTACTIWKSLEARFNARPVTTSSPQPPTRVHVQPKLTPPRQVPPQPTPPRVIPPRPEIETIKKLVRNYSAVNSPYYRQVHYDFADLWICQLASTKRELLNVHKFNREEIEAAMDTSLEAMLQLSLFRLLESAYSTDTTLELNTISRRMLITSAHGSFFQIFKNVHMLIVALTEQERREAVQILIGKKEAKTQPLLGIFQIIVTIRIAIIEQKIMNTDAFAERFKNVFES